MSKRGNGEGSIYQRGDGRWVGAISQDGQPRKVIYGGTRREVDAKLDELKEAKRKGLPLAGVSVSLGEFVTSWLEALTVARKRDRTIRRYEQLMRLHVTPTLGRRSLVKLAPEELEHLYAEKLRTLGDTTVHHIHAAVHLCLAHAMRKGHVGRNVADLVDAPAIKATEMQTLDESQVQRLFDEVAGDRLEALYVVAFSTGMRLSELLGLRWRDVDFATGEIHVRTTLEKYHGEIAFAEPKTKGSRRNILVASQAKDALRRHRIAQNVERIAAGSAWTEYDLVFANEVGEPVADTTFRRAYHRHLRHARLPIIRIHDSRHTAATTLLGRGVHAKIVSEMLGHSRIATTMDLYSHVTPTMQGEARSAMEAAIGGKR